ncbi:ABC transporter permease [Microbacterium sp.]|uniref:ABC transporter permease n=1 Tax=Microbacterium sp. TaxID=51671 RepID=UPI003A85B231
MNTAPSFASSAVLVAEREIGTKLRSKAFVLSFAFLFVAALVAVVWGGMQARETPVTHLAVTADAQSALPAVDGFEITGVADRTAAEDQVLTGEVDAAVVADSSSPLGYALLVESDFPGPLVLALSQQPPVEVLDPAAADPLLRYFVALGFGLVFFMSAMLFGTTIAQSVVEEKQTRVIELLLSAIPARALLAGKVIGNTVLAMGQILVLGAIVVVGLTVTDQTTLLTGIGAPLAWFAIFFLFGFVLLAALYAGAAAMVSRQEDLGATSTPLMLLVMLPYFAVIFFNSNPTVLTVMSYVPFSAPVGMPMRLFLGEAQWWEPLVSLGILAVTCVGAIIVGAKIYENSLLRMGSRVTLREALHA